MIIDPRSSGSMDRGVGAKDDLGGAQQEALWTHRSTYWGCGEQSLPFYGNLILGDLEGTRKGQRYLCYRKAVVFHMPGSRMGREFPPFSPRTPRILKKGKVPGRASTGGRPGPRATPDIPGAIASVWNSLRFGYIPGDSNGNDKLKRNPFSNPLPRPLLFFF